MRALEVLDKVVDVVLKYRPPKKKGVKKRTQREKGDEKKKGKS
jgi:hypothetical protein